jgi:CheY-like chemotaxis protein
VLEGPHRQAGDLLERCQVLCDLVRVSSLADGLALLRREHFDGFFADPREPAVCAGAGNFFQAEHILQTLTDGVAVVGADLRITWANPTFEQWCGGRAVGRGFYEALGSPQVVGPDVCPFHTALNGHKVATRLGCGGRFFDMHLTPLHEPGSHVVTQIICLGRDVSAEMQQQQKLDALHKAGRELAALSADQLAEMSVEERVDLLKRNIRRFTHDLLQYHVIEIRLLDRVTGRLEPLLEEGMTPEAARRALFAKAQGNGVTGLVAATGKTYLCRDITRDPHYLEGCHGAHSSLTVPLVYMDQVIGTFNVESPKPNAFGPDDVQFAEIFSRELASALHTLELLLAEKRSAATQSVEAIRREVALPVDEILNAAAVLLERYIGHDPDMAEKLRNVLHGAREIRQSIEKVGEEMAPAAANSRPGDTPSPRLKGMRVLVADNDERVRKSAHGILGRWGCVVETARDGQEALTMARLGNYDAVLADIRLPDLNGYEVFRGVREALPRARVILMSTYGYDATHSIVNSRKEGLKFVLYKPFRIDQLRNALEEPDAHPGALPA